MDTIEDDQAVFTNLMYMFPDRICLDYQHEMFGNARWTKGMEGGGCPFDIVGTSMSLRHSESKTCPLFLHTPGKFIEYFHRLVDHVGIVEENIEQKKKEQKRRGLRHITPIVEHHFSSPTESADPVENYGNYGRGGRRLNRALLHSIVSTPDSQGAFQVP